MEKIRMFHHCSALMSRNVALKRENSRAFTIPCTIVAYKFDKSLCDLRVSINLM